MGRLKDIATSGKATKIALAGVLALGVTFAVSTFAAGGKKGKPARTSKVAQKSGSGGSAKLTITAPGLPKFGGAGAAGGPPAPSAVVPARAKYNVSCNGNPGNQRSGSKGTLNPGTQNKKLQFKFTGKSKKLVCNVRVFAPATYKAKAGETRKVTLKPGGSGSAVVAFEKIIYDTTPPATPIPSPAPGMGNIELTMANFPPVDERDRKTIARSTDNSNKYCQKSMYTGGLSENVSGPSSEDGAADPLPASPTGLPNWYEYLSPEPRVYLVNCMPGTYEVQIIQFDYPTSSLKRETQTVPVQAGTTASRTFQY